MSKLLFTMTDAGRQELVNANKTGTNKVEIVSVGLGSRYYVTSTSQTNITDEIKRLTTIGGKVVSPDTIHVTAKDDSKDEYVVHTIGLYTNKGTLFAVYSQEQAIINKASSTIALISSDIAIKTLDTKNITFGDIEFINPPATETVVGVARFANEQEIDAGTDDSLAVSAKRLKQAIVKHEQSRNHPDATLTSKGFVQLSSATNSTSETLAATPKAVKAAYDLANGKYTAQDATTARKGIVQLSSATDSQREDRAATSKAVSEAMENAEGRLSKEQNGRDILDKASFVNNVGAARAYGRDISLGAGEWTTSEFVAWLKENGAFDQPYWMMKASLPAVMNKVITDTGLGKINLGGCAIEVMGTYDAAIVRVTIGEYGMTGFLNGTVCTCTVYGDTQRFYWRADYTTKNKPDAASTTQKGVVQLTSATDSTSETLAATAKAVKIAMDNASARLAKDRNGADIPNKPLFIQNVGLQETVNKAGNAVQKNGDTLSGGLTFENDSILAWIRNTDWAKIGFKNDADGDTDSYMWFETGDNGNEYFKWRSKQSTTTKDLMTLKWDALNILVNAVINGSLGVGTTNALGGSSIVLGDNDTGFKQNGDGILDVYANSQRVFRFQNGVAIAFKNIQAGDSKKFSLSSSNTSTKNVTFNLWGASTRPVVAELGDEAGWHFYSQRNTDNSVIFSVNGQIQPSNWGNFDSRYVKDVRLGTRVVQLMARGGRYEKAGHAITGLRIIGEVDGDDEAIFRPIQKYINGTWYNVAQV
ncbi:tail fiber protein [Escherichia coli]|uniref:tail fiber protein n=3 Tax=Enterobacteriaceae TaxID=543 RepID=UPI002238BB04|nr:tail fiber protein [Escherichia coli]MCW7126315.1 tail fiber protein [Escherichia coli]